ncbi:hypothetical protein V8G54_028002 [Vigna mungo]|uniref:non-specific serine/threonine protein kinase n=1 Tax=Vigna mungo TaxID=3915 RepID=A0AAQ3MRL1_VIGMU
MDPMVMMRETREIDAMKKKYDGELKALCAKNTLTRKERGMRGEWNMLDNGQIRDKNGMIERPSHQETTKAHSHREEPLQLEPQVHYLTLNYGLDSCYKTLKMWHGDRGNSIVRREEETGKMSKDWSASKCKNVLPHETPDLNEHYIVGQKVLGKGRLATTYVCTHKETGKTYACKTIPKTKLLCQEEYDDVWREVQILHHLSEHPNVARIQGSYEDKFAVHLVMELCRGGELFYRITQKGYFSEREAAKLMKTIVGVVEVCHAHGVIHRDLKPENFLFDTLATDATLKVPFIAYIQLDFIRHAFPYEFVNQRQTFSDIVGTCYYMAPEVLGRQSGPEVDVWSAGVILYTLLRGLPPFWASVFKQILHAEVDFASHPWPSISGSAKDLIKQMLDKDPKKRISAHELIRMSWLGKRSNESCILSVAPDKPLDPAVLTRLKHFSTMNKLKKMAIRVIVERLSEEEIGGLKEIFKMIDEDNSGTITFQELKDGLKSVGCDLMESEIRSLMDAADIDNNGTIDYGEFLAATMHLNKMEREENLVAAFSYFDKDGSGYITIDELQQACKDFGLGELHLDEMIKEIDQDDDGRINYGEFETMMRRGEPGGCRSKVMNSNHKTSLFPGLGVNDSS